MNYHSHLFKKNLLTTFHTEHYHETASNIPKQEKIHVLIRFGN